MEPIIALIGRCNVGKSTLFNRLTKNYPYALVSHIFGSTRDRQYGYATLEGIKFTIIDTGGINYTEMRASSLSIKTIETLVISQCLKAIKEADLVLFIVDAISGITSDDQKISKYLHKNKKLVFVVVNKINGLDVDLATFNFRFLGFENINVIDSNSGYGVNNFLKNLLSFYKSNINFIKKTHKPLIKFSESELEVPIVKDNIIIEKDKNKLFNTPIKLAIVGRPNVGKSTLINSILGEERVIVYNKPGTTRNNIYISIKYNNNDYILIDTAGMRRKKNINNTIEEFSIFNTLNAIDYSDVVILLINSREDISHQDLYLLNLIINKGRSLIIAMNQWDNLSWKIRKEIKEKINLSLGFVNFTNVHFISALHKIGIKKLFKSVDEVYKCSTKHISSSLLTSIMNKAIKNHKPPLIRGNLIKMKYAHIISYNPITIIIHGNRLKYLPDSYKRYLIAFFRKSINILGSVIRIKLKEANNPYKNKDYLPSSNFSKKYKKIQI
ncbi:ribosome biogenesis GTPase Der [Pantoea sp. SoEX]|uniref:ribosome biogenesis GTPase Der n=1 Tax=Pantoea sp. SoEX TaxID=2576763 RepID=UPI00135918BF|nr:ribosome biogenesis GTPase Der [Pantoea sp. SoEX]MXP50837.1 ribosome biogenesis GTPase Der [Pantoea sp. SoEX]